MGSGISQVCSYICGEIMTTDFLPMTKVVFGATGVVCDIVSHDYGLLQLMSRLDVATGSDECRFEVGYCQYGGVWKTNKQIADGLASLPTPS